MNSLERQELIAKYKEGYNEVLRSLEGFSPDLLTAHPIPGKWSAAEIVHHLSDSESAAGIRIRRLVAEPNPVIYGYDQEEYARALRYNEREIAPSLENFRAVRESTA